MFVTNFRKEELPTYKEAVQTWVYSKDFYISDKCHKEENEIVGIEELEDFFPTFGGSLHYIGPPKDLGSFWDHFREVKKHVEESNG